MPVINITTVDNEAGNNFFPMPVPSSPLYLKFCCCQVYCIAIGLVIATGQNYLL